MKKLFTVLLCLFLIYQFNSKSQEIEWINVSTGLNIGRMIKGMTEDSNGKVFAGTAGNSVYATSDNGNNWGKTSDGMGNVTPVLSMASKGNYIFAGTSRSQIFRSTDSGKNWEQVHTAPGSFNQISTIKVATDGSIYTGTAQGNVFFSTNDGIIWTELEQIPYHIWDLVILENGNILLATMSRGVMRSTDNGLSWKESNEGFGIQNMDVHRLLIDKKGDIYAGTSGYGIYISADNGSSWVQSNDGLGNTVVLSLINTGSGIFAGTNGGIYSSTDSGENWVPAGAKELSDKKIYSMLYTSAHYVFAGDDLGNIFRTSEPLIKIQNKLYISITPETTQVADWSDNVEFQISVTDSEDKPVENAAISVEDNLNNTIDELTTDQNGYIIYSLVIEGGLENGLYEITFQSSKDGYEISDVVTRHVEIEHNIPGNGWQEITTNLPDKRISAFAIKDDLFFASLSAEGCYISSDKGKTWTKSSTGLFMVGTINKYLVHPNGDIFAVSDWDGICRSTDNGASWQTELIPEYKGAYDIVYSQNGAMFASVKDGGVFKSTDNGANWEEFNTGLEDRIYQLATTGMFLYGVGYNENVYKSSIETADWEKLNPGDEEKSFSCIAIGDNENIYAGTYENGVYISDDLGESWTGINEGMETARINNIYAINGYLYTCVFGDGVHLSSDDGKSWEDFNEGFEDLYFKDVFLLTFSDDGYIYASAFKTQSGNGLFKCEMPIVGIEENMIDNINLRIYPNPVSDNTCIDISLTESSNVLVELFDLTGRKIIDIHKGFFDTGNYRIPYDCSELSSGSYILKVNMNGNYLTKLVYVMR